MRMDEQMDRAMIEIHARAMAEALNGGSWDKDYTETQKVGWRVKVEWALENL